MEPDSSSEPSAKRQRGDGEDKESGNDPLAISTGSIARPSQFRNENVEVFEKKFLLQINNVDWFSIMGVAPDAAYLYTQCPYYHIPVNRIFMYLDSVEYQNLVSYKRWAKLEHVAATIQLLSYKPYFQTQEVETQIANQATVQYIDIFHNYKNMHPYVVYNNAEDSTTNRGTIVDYSNATQREAMLALLYGNTRGVHKGAWQYGACDGAREFHQRPTFATNTSVNTRLSYFQSGFNMLAQAKKSWSTQDLGAAVQYGYSPQNGLLTVMQSAVDGYPDEWRLAHPTLTQKVPKVDRVLQTADLTTTGLGSLTVDSTGGIVGNAALGLATLDGYMRTVENSNLQIIGGEKNLPTPPDLLIGTRAAKNNDGSFVRGSIELMITTKCVVRYQTGKPLAYTVDPAVVGATFADLLNVKQRATYDDATFFKTGLQAPLAMYAQGGVQTQEMANPQPSRIASLNLNDDFDL